jgi:hypothetical protein
MAVPSWKQLLITDAFLDRNPDCWMETPEGRLRPASGLCFASRYMGGEGKCLLEVIPGTKFTRIRNSESFWLAWMIDICAAHTDNRQAIFLEDSRSRLDAFFVDHGHLFGGPNGVDRPHFLASRYLDPRIYQSLSPEQRADLPWVMKHVDVDQLWLRVQALPADWITASAVAGFEQCLSRLSSARLLQNVIDTMADAQRTYVTAHNEPAGNRKPPLAAMPQGMPGAGFGHRQVRGQIDRSVCA